MRRRILIAGVAGFVIVVGIVTALSGQTLMSADGDHPTPAVRDPNNPAAPAPSN